MTNNDVYISRNCEIKRPHLMSHGTMVAIDSGFYCTTGLELGSYIHIGPHVSCIGGENETLVVKGFNNIMAGSRIICASDRFDGSGLFGAMIPAHLKGRQMTGGVTMEEFSNLGTNSIILPGSILRRGSLLTAGSLLMGDTEEWGVYKGNPAVLVKRINSEKILQNARELGYEEGIL